MHVKNDYGWQEMLCIFFIGEETNGVVFHMVMNGYEMINQGSKYGMGIFIMDLAQVGDNNLGNQMCDN